MKFHWLRAVVLAVATATGAGATTIQPPSFPELVAEAEVVIRGVVTALRSETFESPQGTGIRTLVTLRVERMLKGAPVPEVQLVQLGGTVAGRTLRIAGVPQFRLGDRQIVFVAGNGRVFCPLVGLGHGRYGVQSGADGEYVVRDNGIALASVEQIALPLTSHAAVTRAQATAPALRLGDFENEILAAAGATVTPNPR